jgi:hypothetical protein
LTVAVVSIAVAEMANRLYVEGAIRMILDRFGFRTMPQL